MKRTYFLPILILIAVLALSGCAAVLSAGSVVGLPALQATATPAPAATNDTLAATQAAPAISNGAVSDSAVAALQGAFERVYEQVNPSVVNIQVSVRSAQSFSQGGGEGSGFVWDAQGHIVTNNHVVEDADEISVTFADGTTVEAQTVGTDPEADLAVIQVDPDGLNLQPVRMADAGSIKVGQLAIAIGNPYGLSGTMTTGIVSALQRSLPVESGSALGGSYTIPDIIQTDAAINPGNSGGVLVNVNGEVLGVTTAIRVAANNTSNTGIGFVVPTNIVQRIVPELIQNGGYEHPRMGVSGTTLTAAIADELGLPAETRGIIVISVSPNSPAARAGLIGADTTNSVDSQQAPTGGDVIIAIDGNPVKTFDDLTSYLFNNTRVGQEVTLTILRGGQEQTLQLTLGVLSQP